jgi:hypothetical protein
VSQRADQQRRLRPRSRTPLRTIDACRAPPRPGSPPPRAP